MVIIKFVLGFLQLTQHTIILICKPICYKISTQIWFSKKYYSNLLMVESKQKTIGDGYFLNLKNKTKKQQIIMIDWVVNKLRWIMDGVLKD